MLRKSFSMSWLKAAPPIIGSLKISSESLYHVLAYGCFDFVVNQRNFQQDFHLECFQLGQDVFFLMIFSMMRGTAMTDVWFYVGECLENDFRAGHPGEEIHMTSRTYFVKEFKAKPYICAIGKMDMTRFPGLRFITSKANRVFDRTRRGKES